MEISPTKTLLGYCRIAGFIYVEGFFFFFFFLSNKMMCHKFPRDNVFFPLFFWYMGFKWTEQSWLHFHMLGYLLMSVVKQMSFEETLELCD